MFCRPFDFVAPSAELLEKCTSRQRRLLGDLGGDWKPGSTSTAPTTRSRSWRGADWTQPGAPTDQARFKLVAIEHERLRARPIWP